MGKTGSHIVYGIRRRLSFNCERVRACRRLPTAIEGAINVSVVLCVWMYENIFSQINFVARQNSLRCMYCRWDIIILYISADVFAVKLLFFLLSVFFLLSWISLKYLF